MSKRISAVIITFLFGAFGIQWFVFKKKAHYPLFGILSVLFFWTTIPTWIAWYHIITILMMDDAAFEKKYVV